MHSRAIPVSSFLFLLTAVLLTGCGMGVTGNTGSVTGAAISGHIIGGQNPVVGATIQMYEVTSGGYGAQAHALLSPTVTTVDGGAFNVTGLYTCTSGSDQVYMVATGGDPGLGTGTNSAIGLMAALGTCSTLPSIPNIIVNEVTTVAAVWPLAPFMKSFDHVGTSAANTAGLVNAFGMANNLASFLSGGSPGNVPTGATVPTAEINSLGNSLAACVNSAGGVAGGDNPCGTLFAAATPLGGTAPTNTIAAALDIALHPGNNVGDIYNVATAQGPFQAGLSAAPNDWTIAVNFPLGAAARQTGGMAFDVSGNLWVEATDALYELSPTGTLLNTFGSMAGNSVAIDATGNIWVGATGKTLLEMPSTLGSPTSHVVSLDAGTSNIQNLALDGTGDVWYTCGNCGSLYKFNPSTMANTSSVGVGVTQGGNVSVDPSEQVWLGSFDTNFNVNVYHNDGTPLSGSPISCGSCGYGGFIANDGAGDAWIVGRNLTRLTPGGSAANLVNGGLFSPSSVAIDGAGNAWVTNTESTVLVQGTSSPQQGALSEFTNAGTAVTSDTAYVSDTLASPQEVAVDGSGSVWLRNSGSTSVTAFVGAGVPVVTPLALGVKNGTLGSEPGAAGGVGGTVTGAVQSTGK